MSPAQLQSLVRALRRECARLRSAQNALKQRVIQRTEQLNEQRSRLQAIIDIAGEGIITIDENGIVESINATGLQMFGYDAAEVLGRNVNMLMPVPEHDAHDRQVRRYIETGERQLLDTVRTVSGRTKAGQVFPIEISVGEMTLSGARLFVARLRDISERQRLAAQARERLEDSAQLQRIGVAGELAGVLAHQLNQPLAAILSFAEAAALRLQRGTLSHDDATAALNDIAAQAKRAASSIRDLRAFLSRDHGDLVACDLNGIVHWVLELGQVLARDARIEVQLALSGSLPRVMVRRVQIEQVLTNLLDNAIDAILENVPSGAPRAAWVGKIVLRTGLAQDGQSVMVCVQDTGPGLDAALARRVFEPLFTSKKNGIGLGLSIAHSIIAAHGGRIWAEPGSSGLFCFTLPRAPHSM